MDSLCSSQGKAHVKHAMTLVFVLTLSLSLRTLCRAKRAVKSFKYLFVFKFIQEIFFCILDFSVKSSSACISVSARIKTAAAGYFSDA